MSGVGTTQADAIDFTGGATNSLILNTTAANGGLSGGLGLSGTVTVTPNAGGTTLTGVLHNYGTATGSLIKAGNGTLRLSAANTYTGGTTVSAGTLLVDVSTLAAAAPATYSMTIAAGATFGGAGTVGGRVDLSGTLSASAAGGATSTVGTLTTAGLTMETGSTLREDVASLSSADLIKAGGAVQVGGTLDLEAPAAFTTAAGQSVTLIDNTSASATTGRFTSLVFNNGASMVIGDDNTFQAYGRIYQINYAASFDGGNNDVVLTDVTPVPSGGGGGSAPAPAATPTITGTHATADAAEAPVLPFSGVTIADGNAGATDSLVITLTGGAGTLTGAGLTSNGAGSYGLAATDPGTLSAELRALSFTPAKAAPGSTVTSTFQIVDTSSAGTAATDAGTSVADTAAAAPPPVPPPPPVAPDTVSISPQVTYADGVFTLSGTASSAAGVRSVEISAQVDGARQDLGAATLNPDGSFAFADAIGDQQTFLAATLTDGAGAQAVSADPGFNLTGGLGPRGNVGRQDSFDATEQVSSTLFRADGTRQVSLDAPGQTAALQPYDVVFNGRQGGNTFVYTPGPETGVVDVIRGFKAGGADHDVVSLKGSDFNNAIANVLRNTGDIGGSAFITDPVTGDAIRLAGVSTAELKRSDFTFHA